MASKKIEKGLGATFVIGPGQSMMKDSMKGPLYVGPKKKSAPSQKNKAPKKEAPKAPPKTQVPTPKPKAKPPVPFKYDPNIPRFQQGPEASPDDAMNAPVFPPKKKDTGRTDRAPRPRNEIGGEGYKLGPFRIRRKPSPETPRDGAFGIEWEGFKNGGKPKKMKSGGMARGDGKSRVKTKGRCI